MNNRFLELLAIFESNHSNRSLDITGKRRDEDTPLRNSTDAEAIFAALGSTGEDYLIVDAPNGPRQRWVRLIWGNDVDVISDYHVCLERWLQGANSLANDLDT